MSGYRSPTLEWVDWRGKMEGLWIQVLFEGKTRKSFRCLPHSWNDRHCCSKELTSLQIQTWIPTPRQEQETLLLLPLGFNVRNEMQRKVRWDKHEHEEPGTAVLVPSSDQFLGPSRPRDSTTFYTLFFVQIRDDKTLHPCFVIQIRSRFPKYRHPLGLSQEYGLKKCIWDGLNVQPETKEWKGR